MPTEILTALSAVISAFLSGLLGIGGGLVLTPLLLYAPAAVGAAALPVKIITGLSIVQALSGSILGGLRHRGYGNVSTRLVRLMGPPGAAASFAGALLSSGVADRVLILMFATFSVAGAIALLLPVRTQEGAVTDLRVNAPLAIGLSLVMGFAGGMVGIGGIAFTVAAMVYLMRIPAHVAVGTSLAIGFFFALPGFVGKLIAGQIDPLLALVVCAGAVIGSPLGAAVSRRSKPRVLLLGLSAVIGLTGLRMYWQALTGA